MIEEAVGIYLMQASEVIQRRIAFLAGTVSKYCSRAITEEHASLRLLAAQARLLKKSPVA